MFGPRVKSREILRLCWVLKPARTAEVSKSVPCHTVCTVRVCGNRDEYTHSWLQNSQAGAIITETRNRVLRTNEPSVSPLLRLTWAFLFLCNFNITSLSVSIRRVQSRRNDFLLNFVFRFRCQFYLPLIKSHISLESQLFSEYVTPSLIISATLITLFQPKHTFYPFLCSRSYAFKIAIWDGFW